jgi:4-hydroxybutyrate CoA-transferase
MKPQNWKSQALSPEEALRLVKSGDRIFVHGASATPTPLLDAMAKRTDLKDVKLYHLHLTGDLKFVEPEFAHQFRSVSLFTGAGMRKPIEEGRADFMPIFLSEIPSLVFKRSCALRCCFFTTFST